MLSRKISTFWKGLELAQNINTLVEKWSKLKCCALREAFIGSQMKLVRVDDATNAKLILESFLKDIILSSSVLTVWKINHFSLTHILRETNFGEFQNTQIIFRENKICPTFKINPSYSYKSLILKPTGNGSIIWLSHDFRLPRHYTSSSFLSRKKFLFNHKNAVGLFLYL